MAFNVKKIANIWNNYFKNNFEKVLDKLLAVCYNVDR